MTKREQAGNFAFYWRTLQTNESWNRARHLAASLDVEALAYLLREPSKIPGTVNYTELMDRLKFDEALSFLSQIPIGVIAGFFPVDLPVKEREQILVFLANLAVVEYYEVSYRLLLPSLLRMHCTGQHLLPTESSELSWGAFQWFTGLALRFDRDRDCNHFLGLLDGVIYGSLGLREFKALLKTPSEAIQLLSAHIEPPSDKQRCLSGLLRFARYCVEIDRTFKLMDSIPLTRSAIWFYFGYWFAEQKNLSSHTVECVSLVCNWPTKLPNENSDIVAAANETQALSESAVRSLASEKYAKDLFSALQLR